MIPNYQEIMLPLLKLLANKKEMTLRETKNELSLQFNLTEEEQRKLLPSGKQSLFDNRVGWARFYLNKADLLSSPKRGHIEVTERGIEVAKNNISKIDNSFLRQFPEFMEFIENNSNKNSDDKQISVDSIGVSELSPQEQLDSCYRLLRSELSDELLKKILSQSPEFFERLVVQLLVGMGYGGSIADAGKTIGKSGDGGIDGTIKEDVLGLDIIYIQAKRWKDTPVRSPAIRDFVGALAGQGAKKGVFITTSEFTQDAREYSPKNEAKIVLIDGKELTQLMIDYNVGVSTSQLYELKDIDTDFFEDN